MLLIEPRELWKSKTQVVSWELEVQINKLQVQMCELRAQIHELQVQIHKLRVARLKARVGGLKARARRSKGRTEAINHELIVNIRVKRKNYRLKIINFTSYKRF